MGLPGTGEDPGGGGGVGGGGGSGGGSGGSSLALVGSTTVTLKKPGLVDVDGAAMQGFASGPAAWRFELWIDGALVWAPQGTYPGDVVQFGGVKFCQAGERLVELRWRGATSITLGPRYLKVRGFNNVSG